MSLGATNWPFLRFTPRPVRATASTRSVWRQRKAGIWMMSTTSAAGPTWRDLVDVGEHAARPPRA